MLDLDEPVTLSENRLDDGVYKTRFDDGGTFLTGESFEFEIDLDGLVRRRRGSGP